MRGGKTRRWLEPNGADEDASPLLAPEAQEDAERRRNRAKLNERVRVRQLRATIRGVLHHPSASILKAVSKAYHHLQSLSAMKRRSVGQPQPSSQGSEPLSPRQQVQLLRSLLSEPQGAVLDLLLEGASMASVCGGAHAGALPPAASSKVAMAQLRRLRRADRGASLYLQFAFVKKSGKLGVRFVWADAAAEALDAPDEEVEKKSRRVPRGCRFWGPPGGEARRQQRRLHEAAAAAAARAEEAARAREATSQPGYAPAALGRLVGMAAAGTPSGELSADEAQMIFRAMPEMAGNGYTGQGHWYCCPNGHVYAVGDCGGTVAVSQCPECGAVIGGERYVLDEANTVAHEFLGLVGDLDAARREMDHHGW